MFKPKVLNSQKLYFKGFNFLGHLRGRLNAKNFDWGRPRRWRVYKSKNINYTQRVETFKFETSGPKDSNSKKLTFWGHLSGSMCAKSYDLG